MPPLWLPTERLERVLRAGSLPSPASASYADNLHAKMFDAMRSRGLRRERSGDSEDEASPGPRTVFTWGGTFAIYQSQKPGNQEQLEALKRETGTWTSLPSSTSTCTL